MKSRIGFVYDVPGYWDDRTLESQRRAARRVLPGLERRTFDRLAAEFGLPLDRTYKALSHGTKTKFALAMALSHDADLLILDEPTAGLDPVFRREFLRRLSALLQDEGKSVLFSTHITSDLDRIADYITFVRPGRGRVLAAARRSCSTPGRSCAATNRSLRELDPGVVRGRRAGRFGIEVLVSDAREAARTAGPAAVVDRPYARRRHGADGRGVRSCCVTPSARTCC